MSYANFKSIVWSKHIQGELPKHTIFEPECDYAFKGEVGRGKTVKILGVARPTLGDYTGEAIGDPEIIPDSAMLMQIDQAKYFNFMVDDVDAAQGHEGLMTALMNEATRAMAEERDSYIAKLCATGCGNDTSSAVTINSKATAKSAVDGALTWLWDQGVSMSRDKVSIYLDPKTYMYLNDYILEVKNRNDRGLENGVLGRYMGADVKMTNNLYNDGSHDFLIVKTSKAVAFASAIDEIEAYRPQGLFSDAVKGLNTFGGKVVRPKELYAISATVS